MDLSDRELLIRIDERVGVLHDSVKGSMGNPGLETRVDSLESDRDKIKGLAHISAGGGVLGAVASAYHFLSHFVGGK
jgi:hypothetical protein